MIDHGDRLVVTAEDPERIRQVGPHEAERSRPQVGGERPITGMPGQVVQALASRGLRFDEAAEPEGVGARNSFGHDPHVRIAVAIGQPAQAGRLGLHRSLIPADQVVAPESDADLEAKAGQGAIVDVVELFLDGPGLLVNAPDLLGTPSLLDEEQSPLRDQFHQPVHRGRRGRPGFSSLPGMRREIFRRKRKSSPSPSWPITAS